MLVYADGSAREALQRHPPLDRAATAAFVATLFLDEKLTPLDDGDLSFTCPPDNEIYAGCFDGVSVIAARSRSLATVEEFSEASSGGSPAGASVIAATRAA